MSAHFSSSAHVSCVVFPIANQDKLELFLSTAKNYSVGKIVRNGTDAAHGLLKNDRFYNASAVRQNLLTVEEHEAQLARELANRMVVARQGHGNIGFNNWAIAYVKANRDANPRLILPVGEIVHERIYPCFVKRRTSDGSSHYSMEDIVVFAKGDQLSDSEITTLDAVDLLKYCPGADRELCEGDLVVLPIWQEKYANRPIVKNNAGDGIDWRQFDPKVRFAKLKRRIPESDVVNTNLQLVRLLLPSSGTDASYVVYPLPQRFLSCTDSEDVEFAFFGIPVEGLALSRSVGNAIDGGNSRIDRELAKIVHYFYDMRHIFDLCRPNISRWIEIVEDGVTKKRKFEYWEFNLFEYALKRDNFKQARDCLAQGTPVEVNLDELESLSGQSEPVVREFLASRQFAEIQSLLEARGYRIFNDRTNVVKSGDCALICKSGSKRVSKIIVMPLRAVYPYSFIGVVTGKLSGSGDEEQEYAILAVTGGASGVRPGTMGPNNTMMFSPPMRFGYSIEGAVAAVQNEIVRIFGDEVRSGDTNKLLLLDQGGDVHQWLGAGNLKAVIGSSEGRAKMSAEMFLTAPI